MLAFGKAEKIFSSSTSYKQSGMYSKGTPSEKNSKPGAYRGHTKKEMFMMHK